MAVRIVIRGTVIDFPSSGTQASWAAAVDQFAIAVEDALDIAVGQFDIPPQTQTIDAYNSGTADITNLLFSNTEVRSATVTITTHRTNTVPSVEYSEVSTIDIVYNASNPTNNKWEIAREQLGDASINFSISDVGQFSFTTTSIGSGVHTGKLSFSAKALQSV